MFQFPGKEKSSLQVSRLLYSEYINYPGFLEVRSYSKPKLKSCNQFKKAMSIPSFISVVRFVPLNTLTYLLCSYDVLPHVKLYSFVKQKAKKKQLSSLSKSRSSLKNVILSNSFKGCSMLTVTYREEEAHYSFTDCKKHLNRFLDNLISKLKKIEYIWVAEKTKRGRVHFHILFFGIRKHSIVSNHPFKYGFTYYTPALENVFYCLKYLSKSNDFLDEVGNRIWAASRSINRCKKGISTNFLDGSLFGELSYEQLTSYGCYQLFEKGKKQCLEF